MHVSCHYEHSIWEIRADTSWDACHGATNLCFGHTPTLSELHARHPDGYDWAFMFTPVAHTTESSWLLGAPIDPGDFGTQDPLNPGNFIGLAEFLDRHTLVHSPDTVVYKSYTDTHRKAYWTEIDISTPWLDVPGAIRATRDSSANTLDVELIRVAIATFDLPLAELLIAPDSPLIITLQPLVETVYDPALAAPGEPLEPTLVLKGDFTAMSGVDVLRDGLPLSPTLINLGDSQLAIGPLAIGAPTTLVIQANGEAAPIPTVSEWGMIVMILLVLLVGTVVLGRRTDVTK